MPKGLIKRKLYAYALALPLGIILGVVLYHIPKISVPYKHLFFICAYSAYGIALCILYSFTDFGKSLNRVPKYVSERIYMPFAVFALVLIFTALSGYISAYNPFYIIRKWPWSIALTALFFIMFYIDSKEKKSAAFTPADEAKLSLVNYLSFIILPVIFALLGLYSNAAVALQNLMYLLIVIHFGKIADTLYCPDYLESFLMAFLAQYVMFAQMVMFK